jgi:predicted aspartyl protease
MGHLTGKIERQGPFIDVTVMATHQRVSSLKAAGLPFPQPQTIRALIDTGASCSVLDRNVSTALGLAPTSTTLVHTPSTGSNYAMRDVFDVSLTLGASKPDPATFTLGVIASDLASEGFLALIGWDVLAQCVLTCDGPASVFTLTFIGQQPSPSP